MPVQPKPGARPPAAPVEAAADEPRPEAKRPEALDPGLAPATALEPKAGPIEPMEPEREAPEAPADPRARFDEASVPALRPLVHLMLELRAGQAPSTWAKRCLAPLRGLRPLASDLPDPSIGAALDALVAALEDAARPVRTKIEGEAREALLLAYAALSTKSAAAVDVDAEHGRRDPAVVEALLLQVDGLTEAALEKIRKAGWKTTDRFLNASPEELDVEAGVGVELAAKIIGEFRRFREEFPTVAPDPLRTDELRRLSERLDRLRDEQSRFERACSEWTDAALGNRRALRKSRTRTIQSIHLVLARMGEMDRIDALERVPYAKKVAALAEFLRAEKGRATAAG